MSNVTTIQIRDARDRLIDLLGMGETYPLQDLPVPDAGLTVAFDTPAWIPVDTSQPGVSYHLRDKDDIPVERTGPDGRVAVQADGTGETDPPIWLKTAPISEDVTYRILARKASSGNEAYLHATAAVKVGLDLGLEAWIDKAPLLKPGVDAPSPSDPRIVDYGAQVEVKVANSQDGVDYRLERLANPAAGEPNEVILSVADVPGLGPGPEKWISLRSRPIDEDTDIRIRATKTFDSSTGREPQTDLLEAVLPLKVRANRSLQVSVEPSAVVDFRKGATIRIAQSQRSASYRLFVHRILDEEYVHAPDPDPDSKVVRVPVAGGREVQVRRPRVPELWEPLAGYIAGGDSQPGTGGDLQLRLDPPAAEDCLVIVQAEKTHQARGRGAIPSSVPLAQPAVVLVRPNPAPALRLRVVMETGKTDGSLRVFDGQPGVFYYFRPAPDGPELPWPAYFHKRDQRDDRFNKGLGQLGVEIDFVVAADPPEGKVVGSSDRAQLAPEPPLLQTQTPPLPAGTALYVRAVKAQTRIEAALEQPVTVTVRPQTP